MRYKDFWIALAAGAVVGGVAALLFTPQSGEATRESLREGLDEFGDTLEHAGEYLKAQVDMLTTEAQKLVGLTKSQVDEAIAAATGALQSASSATKQASRLV